MKRRPPIFDLDPEALIEAITNIRDSLAHGELKNFDSSVQKQAQQCIAAHSATLAQCLNVRKARYDAYLSNINYDSYNLITSRIAVAIESGILAAEAFGVSDMAEFTKKFVISAEQHDERRCARRMHPTSGAMRISQYRPSPP